MYYVPDGTTSCGYYECEKCKEKFLATTTDESISCPYCEGEVDMEMGPDDVLPEESKSARLIQVLEGEDVEKMDILLSLAVTGGNYDWI